MESKIERMKTARLARETRIRELGASMSHLETAESELADGSVKNILVELTAQISQVLEMNHRFENKLEWIGNRVTELELSSDRRLGRLERSISAMESFPVLPTGPQRFVGVTERHSVSDPVRRKLGYMG